MPEEAELRRIAQGIRLANVLTVVQLLDKNVSFDEGILRKKVEEATLFVEWCQKTIQESIK